MSHLKTLLKKIRMRPAMYLGSNSIFDFRSFLFGYDAALTNHNIEVDRLFDDELSFHDWIAMRTGIYESTSGWANMLIDSYGEKNALEMFFIHYDEYGCRTAIIERHAFPSARHLWKTVKTKDTECAFSYITPYRVEIARYTNDSGFFVRFLDSLGKLIDREEYAFDEKSLASHLLNIPIANWVMGASPNNSSHSAS